LSTTLYKNTAAIEAAIADMAQALAALLAERASAPPLMIGIHTGGVWVAERLHRLLDLPDPLGQLDISFYRDDFTRIGMQPRVRPSTLPVSVDDRALILVDDVLQSGRTVRAALNVLFDYGRPSAVLLAVLAERDGRELPIEPSVVGLHAHLGPGEHLKLSGPDELALYRGTPPAPRQGDHANRGDDGEAAG
jgi:pyrimidine operon attenuation protein/uracil phosphoribosyltransferase